MAMPIEEGLEAALEHVVSDADTASAMGSGDVAVFATPAVVALCERAAVAALASRLGPGQTSVGTNITLDHLAPTAPGRRVEARARLESVDGRMLHFDVEAHDGSGLVARGTHVRMVVDRARFLDGADERA